MSYSASATMIGNTGYEVSNHSSNMHLTYDSGVAPPVPPRHEARTQASESTTIETQYQAPNIILPPSPPSPYDQTPPLPPRSLYRSYSSGPNSNYETYPAGTTPTPQGLHHNSLSSGEYLPPPPQRYNNPYTQGEGDDLPSHIPYTRDPQKVVAYLVPFPKPKLEDIDPATIPSRFLIYTPPPPPLKAPKEGDKEGKLHKVQRKWQEEVRSAKTSTAKVNSWQGVKSRATKAIAWGVNQTTSSNIEFLGRINGDSAHSDIKRSRSSSPTSKSSRASPSPDSSPNKSGYDRCNHQHYESSPPTSPSSTNSADHDSDSKGVNEILLVYPPSMAMDNQQMRTEFVNTMLRTKSKAQRDSIIATGLLPVGFAIDILATLIWPFGGLAEIDSVWLYSSVRGARTASSVTKRLGKPTTSEGQNQSQNQSHGQDHGPALIAPSPPAPDPIPAVQTESIPTATSNTLHLNFHPSPTLDILTRYLEAECHRVDSLRFPEYRSPPTESQILQVIGWAPTTSQTDGFDIGFGFDLSSSSHSVLPTTTTTTTGDNQDLEAMNAMNRRREDEQWEMTQVKEDVKSNMHKGAKEWRKFCVAFAKDPEKAMKKK